MGEDGKGGTVQQTAALPRYEDLTEYQRVSADKVELDGPFECLACGGHIMIDASYTDQVSDELACPYCGTLGKVPV